MAQRSSWMKLIPAVVAMYAVSLPAGEWYVVRSGDTLSAIVEAQTAPPPALYGPRGRLAKVLAANKAIANPDQIEVGQKIYLAVFPRRRIASIEEGNGGQAESIPVPSFPAPLAEELKKETPPTASKTAPQKELKPVTPSVTPAASSEMVYPRITEFKAHYRLRRTEMKQKGVLGKMEVPDQNFNALSVAMEAQRKNWRMLLAGEFTRLTLETDDGKHYQNINHWSLAVGKGKFFVRPNVRQVVILRRNDIYLGLARLSVLGVLLGYGDQRPFWQKGKWEYSLALGRVVKGWTDHELLKLQGSRGWQGQIHLAFKWPLLNENFLPLKLIWDNELFWQQLQEKIDWDDRHGQVKLSLTEFFTGVGVAVEF